MIWSFERGSEQARCEVRRQVEGDGYELVITRPDSETVERFDDPAALIDRSVAYLDALRREGWNPVPSPQSPF